MFAPLWYPFILSAMESKIIYSLTTDLIYIPPCSTYSKKPHSFLLSLLSLKCHQINPCFFSYPSHSYRSHLPCHHHQILSIMSSDSENLILDLILETKKCSCGEDMIDLSLPSIPMPQLNLIGKIISTQSFINSVVTPIRMPSLNL